MMTNRAATDAQISGWNLDGFYRNLSGRTTEELVDFIVSVAMDTRSVQGISAVINRVIANQGLNPNDLKAAVNQRIAVLEAQNQISLPRWI